MPESTMCCREFNPEPWDKTTHEWRHKPFITDTIPQIFHMPLPSMYRRVIMRMWKKAERYGIAPELKDFMLLAFDPSPWKSELYMVVTKELPEAETVTLTGSYVSMVFDGPYSGAPRYLAEFERYIGSLKKKAKKIYFYFTTCPKCAKKYGHNYIVVLGEL